MRGTKSIQRIRLLSLFTLIGSIMLAGCTVNSNDRVPTPNMGVNPYRVNTGYLLRNAVERGTLRIATERDYPPFSYHGTGGRLTGLDVEVAEEVAGGADKVNLNPVPSMGAEDFSYMLLERPGCYIWTGNGESAGLHHPEYDFNDQALLHGASYWSRLVERRLAKSA